MGDDSSAKWSRRPFRLAVEAGSKTLQAIFDEVPCGCERAEKALALSDPAAQRGELAVAERLAKGWGCSRAGYGEEKRGRLQRDAAKRVKELCGYETDNGCPREALYREDVQRACDFRASKLSPLVEPNPPALLVEIVLRVMPDQEAKLLERMRSQPQLVVSEQGPISSPSELPRKKKPR